MIVHFAVRIFVLLQLIFLTHILITRILVADKLAAAVVVWVDIVVAARAIVVLVVTAGLVLLLDAGRMFGIILGR